MTNLEDVIVRFGNVRRNGETIVRLPGVIFRDAPFWPPWGKITQPTVVPEQASESIGEGDRLSIDRKYTLPEEVPNSALETSAISTLVQNAWGGDRGAIEILARNIRALTIELNLIAEEYPAVARAIAQKYSEWPVVVSPLDTDIKRVKEYLKRLKVGSKSAITAYFGQKRDRTNFWTRYAEGAWIAFRVRTGLIPLILPELNSGGIEVTTSEQTVFTEAIPIHCYRLPDATTIELPEWLLSSKSPQSGPLEKVWPKLRLGILEYWTLNPKEYSSALKQYGSSSISERMKRKRALECIHQALESVVSNKT